MSYKIHQESSTSEDRGRWYCIVRNSDEGARFLPLMALSRDGEVLKVSDHETGIFYFDTREELELALTIAKIRGDA